MENKLKFFKKKWCIIVVFLLAFSCSKSIEQNEIETVVPEEPTFVEKVMIGSNNYKRSLDVALTYATEANTVTKSPRVIKSVDYITTSSNLQATKSIDGLLKSSGIADTMMYVINYEDNLGFAIVAADARIAPIIAIADEGSIDMENLPGGAELVLNGVIENIADEIIRQNEYAASLGADSVMMMFSYQQDNFDYNAIYSLCSQHQNDLNNGYVDVPNPWEERPEEPSPIYSKSVGLATKYHQNEPFNYLLPPSVIPDKISAAGCVPVAVAQIMAFHGHPTVVGGLTMPWASMNHSSIDENSVAMYGVQKLLLDVGTKLNAQWGFPTTSAATEDVPGVLAQYGYVSDQIRYISNLTSPVNVPLISVFEDLIIESIDNYRPVYMGGVDFGNNDPTADQGDDGSSVVGHAWVVDGYQKTRWSTATFSWCRHHQRYELVSKSGSESSLLKINWGWGGNPNAYYSIIGFNPVYNGVSQGSYNNDIQFISNIRPIN